jgi:hypothetical protein
MVVIQSSPIIGIPKNFRIVTALESSATGNTLIHKMTKEVKNGKILHKKINITNLQPSSRHTR